MNRDRAQSEVVGNILLVAIVVTGVSVAGVAAVATVGPDEATLADVGATVAGGPGSPQVVFTHRGGDPIDDSTLVVRIWVDGSPEPVGTPAATGDGDGRFEPGETRVYALSTAGEGDVVRALVATNATETVLVDERTTVGR